ncbi:MAG TPA: phage tail protein [Candidatus Limosilactobacillus intestinavium]|nr:phage tail protein [Candidatus Limosilactobacillus intestinavium]
MKAEVPALQGIDVLLFARKLSEADKKDGQLIPYQTSLSFDPQRDSDTNATKSGTVSTSSSLETDLEVEFTNNWSEIADQLWDSLFDNEKMEFWIIYRKRKNKDGKYFCFYMRGTVKEDSNDNDPDDTSNRDTSIAVDGKPLRGWTDLSDEAEEQMAYIFRGVGKIDGAPKNDGTDGGGRAWTSDDAGTGADTDDATSVLKGSPA